MAVRSVVQVFPSENLAQLVEAVNPELECLARFALDRLTSGAEWTPSEELGHVLNEDDRRLAHFGPLYHNPRQAANVLGLGSACLGVGEVRAIGAGPKDVAAPYILWVNFPHVL